MSIKIMVFWDVMQLEYCNAKIDMTTFLCFLNSIWLVQNHHYAILKFKNMVLIHYLMTCMLHNPDFKVKNGYWTVQKYQYVMDSS
jgi:hypothetical protein